MHIEHHNAHPNLLKVLVTKGRYQITTTTDNGTLVLSCEDIKEPLVFGKKGTQLDEVISYTLFIPENILIEENTAESLAVSKK